MGIHGLAKVIGDHAPNAIKENEIKNFFGRKVAIDASMCIYQFLIAVRQEDGGNLTNENGETAFMWAFGEGHKEISQMLLEKDNIDINQKNEDGMTALMWASKRGHTEIVEILKEAKVKEINLKMNKSENITTNGQIKIRREK